MDSREDDKIVKHACLISTMSICMYTFNNMLRNKSKIYTHLSVSCVTGHNFQGD